ncbi:hypothetical protein GCM10011611_08820 [Aliidongia dinghuensis]|uniref:ScyD/ScyE family protein n=1 Tax=Aliidongia dinghuensis TaxID=1867774 RepID=A0A8J2YQN1_9PROT|nr:hypothetical protein [Aliidongia dinghuensis]GGF05540.1 hypothetical protein GCM10011611_08820 [Aliidongia dinghuensis]
MRASNPAYFLGRPAAAAILALGLAVSSQASFGADTTAAATAPTPTTGFTLSTFAGPLAGSSQPDSIAVVGATVWVGYGNTGNPDGTGGAKSQIVEYSNTGTVLRVLTVAGHNDGLRYDGVNKKLWALQNEDANANLVLIDPTTAATELFTFGKPLHGGGYDDIVFKDGYTYLSASNPTLDKNGNNIGPAIVRAVLRQNHTVDVYPVMSGTPEAVNFTFGTPTRLNLTDPDSMILTPWGDLLLDDQGDGQLVLLRASNSNEPPIQVIPLQGGMQIDDTAFVTANRGYLLIADRNSNTIYKLSSNVWQVGTAFSASTGVAASGSTPAVPAYVGQIDLHSGVVLPAVTNLTSPHGLAFVAQ